MIPTEAHRASIGRFYYRLKPFSNAAEKIFAFRYDSACSTLVYLFVSLL